VAKAPCSDGCFARLQSCLPACAAAARTGGPGPSEARPTPHRATCCKGPWGTHLLAECQRLLHHFNQLILFELGARTACPHICLSIWHHAAPPSARCSAHTHRRAHDRSAGAAGMEGHGVGRRGNGGSVYGMQTPWLMDRSGIGADEAPSATPPRSPSMAAWSQNGYSILT
jgi:hypothetical protein